MFAPLSVSMLSIDGAPSWVRAAPALPAPKMPSAVPCSRRGNQTEENAMPTAKLVPVMPKPSPASRNPE